MMGGRSRRAMSGAVVSLACLGAIAGCTQKSTAPTAEDSACADPPADWVAWIIRTPEGRKQVSEASDGWVALYRRRYAEALATFQGVDDAAAGQARAHAALAELYMRLSRLHARAVLAYLEARRAARARPLKARSELAVVAAAVATEPPEWVPVRRPTADLPARVACPRTASAAGAVLKQRLTCDDPPACPAELRPPRAKTAWNARITAYAEAICNPGRAEIDRLRTLASTPAVTETVTMPGEVVSRAVVELYDPLALWTLGYVHQRRAETLGASLDEPMAYAFSGRSFEGPTKTVPLMPPNAEAARAAAAAHRETLEAARRCASDPAGARLVDELGVGTSLADGVLRRTAGALLDAGQCDSALGLLRSTIDPAAADRVTYRNEPGFLVRLAEAAVCMRRSSEAIGALRAVRRIYPEAKGVLTAVEQLAVARLMGGVGGLHKRQ